MITRPTNPRPITRPFHRPPVGGLADQAKVRAGLLPYRHQLAGRRIPEILSVLWSDLARLDGDRLDAAIRERLALRENAHYLVQTFDPRDRVDGPVTPRGEPS